VFVKKSFPINQHQAVKQEFAMQCDANLKMQEAEKNKKLRQTNVP
jgi:hypothetical protein